MTTALVSPGAGLTVTLRLLAFVTIAVGVLLAGCDQASAPTRPAGSSRPQVVATFFPLGDFARHVAGDRAEVTVLVPPGVEPHDWEPSPYDVIRVSKASVFIFNGGGFEPWVQKLLKDQSSRRTVVVVEATAGLDLRPRAPLGGDDLRRVARGAPDPHAWLDPVLAQALVDRIREGLDRADPASRAIWDANAIAYKARLSALHLAFETGLARCERRQIFVSHAAFGHLASRYGLDQVAVMGLSPEAEPSPADLAAIVRLARRQQVRHIFSEPLVSRRLAETLAREVGAELLVLNPLEGLTRDEMAAGKDYVAVMEDNLRSLRAGLGCS